MAQAAIGLECGSWEKGCVGAYGSVAGSSMQVGHGQALGLFDEGPRALCLPLTAHRPPLSPTHAAQRCRRRCRAVTGSTPAAALTRRRGTVTSLPWTMRTATGLFGKGGRGRHR